MHPSWGAYPDTVLRFPEADLLIDLRLPIGLPSRLALAGIGLTGSFAVVTACDPLGRPLGGPSNRRLMAVFDALVRERYPTARQAHGASPDGRHAEPGWALPIPLPEAISLAARFFQNGLFWYDANRFSIVPVLAPYPLLLLPEGVGDH